METKIVINNNRGEVQAFEGDVQVGQINFNKEEGLLSIEHTEVIEAFAKKGVAGILVQAATDYAVHHELKVKPICSYARKWFKQHRQYKKIVVDLK